MLRAEFTPRITLPAFTTVHTSTGHFPAFQQQVVWCGVDTFLLSAVCRLAILLVHMHVCDREALVPLHTPLASGHIALWPTTCDYAVQVSTFGMVVRGPPFLGLHAGQHLLPAVLFAGTSFCLSGVLRCETEHLHSS